MKINYWACFFLLISTTTFSLPNDAEAKRLKRLFSNPDAPTSTGSTGRNKLDNAGTRKDAQNTPPKRDKPDGEKAREADATKKQVEEGIKPKDLPGIPEPPEGEMIVTRVSKLGDEGFFVECGTYPMDHEIFFKPEDWIKYCKNRKTVFFDGALWKYDEVADEFIPIRRSSSDTGPTGTTNIEPGSGPLESSGDGEQFSFTSVPKMLGDLLIHNAHAIDGVDISWSVPLFKRLDFGDQPGLCTAVKRYTSDKPTKDKLLRYYLCNTYLEGLDLFPAFGMAVYEAGMNSDGEPLVKYVLEDGEIFDEFILWEELAVHYGLVEWFDGDNPEYTTTCDAPKSPLITFGEKSNPDPRVAYHCKW